MHPAHRTKVRQKTHQAIFAHYQDRRAHITVTRIDLRLSRVRVESVLCCSVVNPKYYKSCAVPCGLPCGTYDPPVEGLRLRYRRDTRPLNMAAHRPMPSVYKVWN